MNNQTSKQIKARIITLELERQGLLSRSPNISLTEHKRLEEINEQLGRLWSAFRAAYVSEKAHITEEQQKQRQQEAIKSQRSIPIVGRSVTPGASNTALAPEEVAEIWKYHWEGKSQREIARMMHIDKRTVANYLEKEETVAA